MFSRIHRQPREFGCWPLADHLLLLRAALLSGSDAISAWETWQRRVEFEAIDTGSFRLLPLVYRNLTGMGVASPLLGRLRGIYRQTWYKNTLLVGRVADLVRRFAEAGIDTLLLKGVPLSLLYYEDVALRPMADADLLVPVSKAQEALAVVRAAGWVPQHGPGEWPSRLTASRCFADALGLELDLHCHVLHECLSDESDDDFWAHAAPLDVGGVMTLALTPADQLLHVIVHGLRRSEVAPVRWVADATKVIRAGGSRFDWDRLVLQARKRRLTRIVGSGLRYLRTQLDVPVPLGIIGALETAPASVTERVEHWARSKPGGMCRAAGEEWCDYRRSVGLSNDWRGPLGLLHYLRDRRSLASSWSVPAVAARRVMRCLARRSAGPN